MSTLVYIDGNITHHTIVTIESSLFFIYFSFTPESEATFRFDVTPHKTHKLTQRPFTTVKAQCFALDTQKPT